MFFSVCSRSERPKMSSTSGWKGTIRRPGTHRAFTPRCPAEKVRGTTAMTAGLPHFSMKAALYPRNRELEGTAP